MHREITDMRPPETWFCTAMASQKAKGSTFPPHRARRDRCGGRPLSDTSRSKRQRPFQDSAPTHELRVGVHGTGPGAVADADRDGVVMGTSFLVAEEHHRAVAPCAADCSGLAGCRTDRGVVGSRVTSRPASPTEPSVRRGAAGRAAGHGGGCGPDQGEGVLGRMDPRTMRSRWVVPGETAGCRAAAPANPRGADPRIRFEAGRRFAREARNEVIARGPWASERRWSSGYGPVAAAGRQFSRPPDRRGRRWPVRRARERAGPGAAERGREGLRRNPAGFRALFSRQFRLAVPPAVMRRLMHHQDRPWQSTVPRAPERDRHP